jgi:hypothetical protein
MPAMRRAKTAAAEAAARATGAGATGGLHPEVLGQLQALRLVV